QAEEAYATFDRLHVVAPDDLDALRGQRDALAFSKSPKVLLHACEVILQKDPSDRTSWTAKGSAHEAIGQPAEALVAYDTVLRLDPHNADASGRKASLLLGLGRNEEAVKAFDVAIEANPASASLWLDKAKAQYRTGAFADAADSLQRTTRYAPEDPKGWYLLGLSLERYEEAAGAFGQAAVLDPTNAAAILNQGACLMELHRFEEAVPVFQTVLLSNPKEPTALRSLSSAFEALGRTKEALDVCVR